MTFDPIIDNRIFDIAPGFRAMSVTLEGDGITGSLPPALLSGACDDVRAGNPVWAEAHLAQWDRVYEAFGAKPNRTPSSARALRKRVIKDRGLPAIDPFVDLYNAVSLRFAIPVGGEDIDAYAGCPRLTIADGDEMFDTMANGTPCIENPAAGEVIWRDDVGVTCRRWNWRQGTRTRLGAGSRRMWFVLESLAEMPEDALRDACDMLVRGLDELMPGARIVAKRVG